MTLNKTQKRIIELLFLKKTASKKELASEMNLSQAALTLASKPLADEGFLLFEGKKTNGKAGRNEELLSLNPKYGCFLGVDAKITSITLTEMDLSGNLLFEEKFHNDEALFKKLKAEIKKNHILGLSITYRKNLAQGQHKELNKKLSELDIPFVTYVNNVEALANVYYFLHQEERNFLLIKYGPGLGSSIYVNGEPIKSKDGTRSEIGHAYLSNGSKLEDLISFETLLGKNVDEKEGAEEVYANKDKLKLVMSNISLGLLDADALLALDKIIFSGVLLTKREVIDGILEIMHKYNDEFNEEKVSSYPDYEEVNRKKATLQAFIEMFH